MLVFIPDIPESVTQEDLCSLVGQAFEHTWVRPLFGGQWQATRCDVLEIRDPAAGTTEYHGLIEMEDERAGQTLIRQLRGMTFRDRTLEAKEFHIRNQGRERRRALPENINLAIVDRRRRDRRRAGLQRRVLFDTLTVAAG